MMESSDEAVDDDDEELVTDLLAFSGDLEFFTMRISSRLFSAKNSDVFGFDSNETSPMDLLVTLVNFGSFLDEPRVDLVVRLAEHSLNDVALTIRE